MDSTVRSCEASLITGHPHPSISLSSAPDEDSAPSRLEGTNQQVATASGLQQGRYILRLTVTDQQGVTESTSLPVRVQEGQGGVVKGSQTNALSPTPSLFPLPLPAARSLPPVAHASGSHTLTLPNSSLVLRGSVTSGDQSHVHFLWVRDRQSPAAGVS